MGSSSYITNLDAQIVQHVEYVPFGEVFIEERNQSRNTPYLFNGKELVEETGLYYYGARYYNPRESVWLSTDPLSGYNPIMETEHYIDGQHNRGVFNSKNHNTYGYCYQNPVVLIDTNGKQTYFIHGTISDSSRWTEGEGPRTVRAIMRLTNSKYYNTGFNWFSPLLNYQNYKLQAAISLKDYVLKHRVEGQEITLVGHSHGGNVAIQASKMIFEAKGEKVNLITIATPAYNKLSKWSKILNIIKII
ncbi:RHS repeat-associated core domain-containing protein [Apibacter adventoris]|uniref:RHS repeat-associated core domain-containing protein n=1 Tax=Apibacter adventoris TaxID=1679466 RepID=UPI0026B7D9CD|nr:RHS repeat-associated core domain-containing protein [Apibacter adventoris]